MSLKIHVEMHVNAKCKLSTCHQITQEANTASEVDEMFLLTILLNAFNLHLTDTMERDIIVWKTISPKTRAHMHRRVKAPYNPNEEKGMDLGMC